MPASHLHQLAVLIIPGPPVVLSPLIALERDQVAALLANGVDAAEANPRSGRLSAGRPSTTLSPATWSHDSGADCEEVLHRDDHEGRHRRKPKLRWDHPNILLEQFGHQGCGAGCAVILNGLVLDQTVQLFGESFGDHLWG